MSSIEPPTDQPDLVRCDITGNMVSPDEVVTIQGYTVCAEGKAELMEKLRSGELLPGELERPTILRRFACLFVDGLIFGIINWIVGAMVGVSTMGGVTQAELRAPDSTVMADLMLRIWITTLALNIAFIAYQTYFHGKWGQTLGKMAGKIKVVSDDGQPISMQTAFIRSLLYHGPSLLALIPVFLFTDAAPTWDIVVGVLASGYFIVSVVMALVDRAQQRAIHDRLASTRVVTSD
ncbi:MAG: RDD family protein [Phycisphaeraceae bacterium]